MSQGQAGSQPGFSPRLFAEEKQVWWSGRGGQNLLATRQVTIASTATDATASPTTTLRAGTILALRSSDNKAVVYNPAADDGSQFPFGILERAIDMLVDGVATERFATVLVQGLIKEDQVHGLDARARQLLSARFLFDRHLQEKGASLLQPRGVARKGGNYTVTAADHGTQFVATAAATFTLPTIANGLSYRFLQTADANLVIAGSANLLHKGSAAGNQVAFSTTGEKVGSQVLVEATYISSSSLKWVVTNLGGTTATVS
jgi:hypothetical protein